MRKTWILLTVILAATTPLTAQQPASAPVETYDVSTAWPGIHYQVKQIYRIPRDRLLVVFRVYATAQAVPAGVQIGIKPEIPAGTSEEEAQAMKYLLRPFSFTGAILTDDLSHQEFKTVKSLPGEQGYLSDEIIGVLHPREQRMLSIQFPVPPPPVPVGGATPKQTLSLLFPKANKPITGLLVPPPGSPLPQ